MHKGGSSRPGAEVRQPARLAVAMASLLMLAGCKPHRTDAGRSDATMIATVRTATEQAIRVGTPKASMRFRGVQVYEQATPGHWAVCGLVAPFADDPEIFVPFVSVATAPGDHGAAFAFEQHVGTTTSEADHVYIALVSYCYDKGGPTTGPVRGVTPMPPLPDTVRDPSVRIAKVVPSRPSSSTVAAAAMTAPHDVAVQGAASGSVTMRQNTNLHASPHGALLRVVQQGMTMRVFGTAPGGWYQVGDASPWGWVHESMIMRR